MDKKLSSLPFKLFAVGVASVYCALGMAKDLDQSLLTARQNLKNGAPVSKLDSSIIRKKTNVLPGKNNTGSVKDVLSKRSFLQSMADGHQSSGGGDVFKCVEHEPKLQKKIHRYYLADTYHFFAGSDNLLRSELSSSSVHRVLVSALNGKIAGEGNKVASLIARLQFVEADLLSYTGGRIPSLDDDFIQEVPGHCTKIQLAIQDWNQGIVWFDPVIFARLSPAEKVLFYYHEALVNLRKRNGDTSLIRERVHALLETPSLLHKMQALSKAKYSPSVSEKRDFYEKIIYRILEKSNLHGNLSREKLMRKSLGDVFPDAANDVYFLGLLVDGTVVMPLDIYVNGYDVANIVQKMDTKKTLHEVSLYLAQNSQFKIDFANPQVFKKFSGMFFKEYQPVSLSEAASVKVEIK